MASSRINEYFPYLDLLKFLCCIGIVCIHTEPFHYIPVCEEYFIKLQPVFVSIFFIISSSLFWRKIQWKEGDALVLWHYIRRLLVLVLSWGIILSFHWVPKFIRHNPDDWMILFFPKVVLHGFAQGSWFILSLIYGILLCYLLNRYLNKHLVFFLVLSTNLYFSLVHYEGMNDFLNIYWGQKGDGFHFESYCSVVRAIIWVEYGFYLVPILTRIISVRKMIAVVILSVVSLAFLDTGYFLLMTAIAIFLSALSMKKITPYISERMILLRKMSIIIFFSHFPIVTVFHVLYENGFLPWEYGFIEFMITFAISSFLAYIIIRLSEKYKILKYLY